MTVIIDGSNGVNIASTTGVINLLGSTSGTLTLQANAVAGTNTLTLPAATGTILTTGNSGKCIAWVNFTATATPSIIGSYNVTSVTYSATGIYAIAFTTAASNANYVVTSGVNYSNAAGNYGYGISIYGLATSGFNIQTWVGSAVALFNASGSVYLAVFAL
jgi:hypothetical protein